jgi:16S rRNA (guanine527-N7)-methyltransferase
MTGEIVTRGARHLGVTLPDGAAAAFETYGAFLAEKNRVMNLTAITGETEIAALHFLDSLALLTLPSFDTLPDGAKITDVGSGAGFPGLPIAIARPKHNVTLLDALQKRVIFLRELCATLAVPNVTCVHARAEEYAATARGTQDIVLSRAVAKLNVLCELCLPLVKVGGCFIAMKSDDCDDEINDARNAIDILAGGAVESVDYVIPEVNIIHRAVIITKTRETPDMYPRRFKLISTRPL